MSRTIDLYVLDRAGGSPHWLSWCAVRVLGYPMDRKANSVKVGGCGMDMGFHLVNSLSYALHGHKPRGDGAKPENAGRPFKPRPGHYRAGYSLDHRWL